MTGFLLPDADPPLEPATADTFDATAYLLANPDIAAWAAGGGDPRAHLERHGLDEGRRQVSRAFLAEVASRRRAKFARFRDVLGDGFTFLQEAESFPIAYGASELTLAAYDRESANAPLQAFVDEVAAHPERRYLDLGCGRRERHFDNCLYLEVYPSRSADIVIAPAATYPIADASLDGIACLAVLEHITEPWIVAAEIRRMLKPGGLAFIDWPFLQPVHGFPSHYYNATRAGLARLFADGFDTVRLDTLDSQAPDRALRWMLAGWTAALTDGVVRDEMLGMTVADLLAEPPRSPFWMRVKAATPPDTRMTYAAGNTLVARRQD